jgi:hypothetical protein
MDWILEMKFLTSLYCTPVQRDMANHGFSEVVVVCAHRVRRVVRCSLGIEATDPRRSALET